MVTSLYNGYCISGIYAWAYETYPWIELPSEFITGLRVTYDILGQNIMVWSSIEHCKSKLPATQSESLTLIQ
jgi:hypothetical protein